MPHAAGSPDLICAQFKKHKGSKQRTTPESSFYKMNSGQYISTDMVEQSVRNDFWREVSSLLYEVTPVNNDTNSITTGSVRSRLLGNMVVGNTTFNDQYCKRSTRLIAQTDLDYYLLQLVLAGEYRGDFNGTYMSVSPGDVFIMDLTQPLVSKKDAGARLTIVISRSDLDKKWANKNLHGLVFKAGTSTSKLLADLMLSIDSNLDNMDARAVQGVQEALLSLLYAALSGTRFAKRQNLPTGLTMRQRVLEFINQNLTDPELSPASIMQHFRLSHSHLYRVFENDAGVAGIIRNKRLDLAYRTILINRHKPLSIKELAFKCGFSARSQFSAFFKERFGLAPRDLQGLQQTIPKDMDSVELFHRYIASRVPD